MKKSNIRKLLILTIIVAFICIANTVFAADPLIIQGNTSTNVTAQNNIQSSNNITNIQSSNNVINTPSVSSYANKSTNTSTLPKTGENDIYIVSVLIIVCAVFAIYTYKKICKYNNM